MNTSTRKILVWAVPSGCLLLALLATAIGLAIHFAASRNHTDFSSRYPAPTSTYRGKTARSYSAELFDKDLRISNGGAMGLQSLGAEGVPFLLQGVCDFDRERDAARVILCVNSLDVNLVQDSDLPLFIPLLAEDRGIGVRQASILFFRKAGARAKPYLKPILDCRKGSNVWFAHVVDSCAHTIDPANYGDPGLAPPPDPNNRPTRRLPN